MGIETLGNMTIKLLIFLRNAVLFFAVFAIGASGFASYQAKKMKTPRNGVIVHRLGAREAKLNSDMQLAKLWAERVDAQVTPWMEVSSLGRVNRWLQNKDFDAMKIEYSKSMMAHLKAMTVIFTAHRRSRGFKKLREFDFQNLIRKSDYLLALYVTKESFMAAEQEGLGREVRRVMSLYNRERAQFDQKIIILAGG